MTMILSVLGQEMGDGHDKSMTCHDDCPKNSLDSKVIIEFVYDTLKTAPRDFV